MAISKRLEHTILITKKVMQELNIPYARVITHQQSSGKSCPMTFINNPTIKSKFFSKLLASTTEKDEILLKALSVLENHKVLNSQNYWYEQAQEVMYLKELLLNMANVLGGGK